MRICTLRAENRDSWPYCELRMFTLTSGAVLVNKRRPYIRFVYKAIIVVTLASLLEMFGNVHTNVQCQVRACAQLPARSGSVGLVLV